MLQFFLILMFSLVAGMSYGAVDIFDQNRGVTTNAEQQNVKKRPVKAQGKAKKLVLTFVGFSQTNAITLYFKDAKNKQLKVKFNPDETNNLPGYPDLIIEKIENRIVYIKDKTMKYCQDNEKTGIICTPESSTIEMHLVRQYVAQPRNRRTANIAKPKTLPANRRSQPQNNPFQKTGLLK